jgi:TP901 family phage tail tape measure protein
VATNSVDIHLNAFANFSPVFAEVTKLKAAMADMQSSSFGSTLSSDYVSGLQKAQQQFTNLVSSTRAFNVQSVQMADSVSQFSKQLEGGQLKLGQYYGIWKENARGVSTQLDALATQQARVARSVVVPDALHAGYAQVITDLNGTVTATEKAAFYQTAYNTTLRDGANKLIDFGKNMQWAGRQLTVGLTVPMALFANQAAQSYLSFDKAMTDMLKVYGSQAVVQSQQALDTIRTEVTDLATNLAHTIGVTMTDTVTIAQTFSQMGLTGKDLLKTTDATAKLMKLGGLSAADSAQAAIAMQNVFKLQSSQMTDAINFLNAAKHSTSTSMQDIVDALPRVGPIITQMGGTYKDFATLLVALRENGVPAAQAANTIKSMFATLINPTTKAINDFNALGISLKGITSADANNPLKMLTDLQAALDKLPSAQRTKAIEELFGKFQFARADALISSLGKAGSQNEKVMQLYSDSSSQLAAVSNQELQIASSGTPAAQYAKMKASLQADLIPIGREFLVIMTKIGNAIDGIAKFVDKLGSMKGVLLGGLAVVGLIGPLVMFAGLFANLVGTIFKGFNYLRMFKEGFNQATQTSPLEKFSAGLKNMSNFYHEVDVSALAASHSTDLMELSAQNSAKAFDVLATAIRNLTTQISALNAVAVNPTGLVSDLQSTITEAGMAARSATGAMQMELPLAFSSGGYVPGQGDSDSQPAFLTPGEAVIPKDKAKRYAPFINAMINGNVGMFNGGTDGQGTRAIAKTNFAHIGLTTNSQGQFGGVDYLASELLQLVADQGAQISAKNMAMLTQLAEKENAIMQALLAKFNGNMELAMANMPRIAALGSFGFTAGGTLNQSLASGSASKAELLADWDKQGLAKWNDSLIKAGLVVSDFSELTGKNAEDLIRLDAALKQGIIDLPNVSKTITRGGKRINVADAVGDEDISKIYLQLQESGSQLNIAESKLIQEFNALAFTFSDFRARNLTPENMGYAGISTTARANGDVYARIGDEFNSRSVRLPSQNNLLDKTILPNEATVREQMANWENMTKKELTATLAQIEEYLSTRFGSAVENSVQAAFTAGKVTAQVASPSKLFMSLGDAITEGTAEGIRNAIPSVEAASIASVEAADAATQKALQMQLPFAQENVKEFSAKLWVPAEQEAVAAGQAMGDAVQLGMEESLSGTVGNSSTIGSSVGMAARLRNSKFLTGGGAMMGAMFAPMLINMIPNNIAGANVSGAKTVLSDVASSASVGAMIGNFLPGEGTAIGAVAGTLVGLFQGVTSLINQKSVDLQSKVNSQITAQGNALLKSTLGVGTALNNLLLFAKNKINGLEGSGGSDYSGVTLGHNSTGGGPLGWLKSVAQGVKDGVTGWISNYMHGISGVPSSTVQQGLDPSLHQVASSWTQLTNADRATGQGLASALEIMQSGNATMSQYSDMLSAINTQTKNNKNATGDFATTVLQAGGSMADSYKTVKDKINLTTTSAGQLFTVLTAVSEGMDASNLSGDNLFTKATDYIKQKFAVVGDTGNNNGGLFGSTGTDYAKIYDPIIKKYTDIKKIIDTQATAQKRYNDELKATQDYQTKQLDYFNQMKMAYTSGNFLQAAQAQQSALQNQADFVATQKQQKLADESANVQTYITALEDAKTQGYSLSSLSSKEGMKIPTSITTAFASQLMGGLSQSDMNKITSQYTRQALSVQSQASTLAASSPFNFEVNISADNSVIPSEFAKQLSSLIAAEQAKALAKVSGSTKNAPRPNSRSAGIKK